jgi:hypothetical protein
MAQTQTASRSPTNLELTHPAPIGVQVKKEDSVLTLQLSNNQRASGDGPADLKLEQQ